MRVLVPRQARGRASPRRTAGRAARAVRQLPWPQADLRSRSPNVMAPRQMARGREDALREARRRAATAAPYLLRIGGPYLRTMSGPRLSSLLCRSAADTPPPWACRAGPQAIDRPGRTSTLQRVPRALG